MRSIFFWIQSLHLFLSATFAADPQCKALPNTTSWPLDSEWKKFNHSIAGHLLKPLPPGSVCDEELSDYNNVTCAKVALEYTQSLFHAEHPVSVDWPNFESDACLPDPNVPCKLDQFPVYVVNASDKSHVKAGVDFARKHNVRLIVKGTGHDFLGRSTAPHSMSIWTHHLRGLDFLAKFQPKGCKTKYKSALRIAAGHQMREIYKAAAMNNAVIVGGADPDVGIGGYVSAGGHSPISSVYGLASDNALEFEMVTPAGDIVTANTCTNKDLFWALKGGGGSTFGVILSVTVQTFPAPSLALSLFSVNSTTNPTDYFWDAVAYIHTILPDLSDEGLMGYTFIYATEDAELGEKMSFAWGFWMLNKTAADVDTALMPLLNTLSNSTFSSGIVVGSSSAKFPDFYTFWSTYLQPGAVGKNLALGSRLLDRKALTQEVDLIKQKLLAAWPAGALLGHLIAGKGVANAQPPGGFGSMTPAWRTAYLHLVVGVSWPYYNMTDQVFEANQLTTKYTQALRDLAPDTGCYLNEADIHEPNLDSAFWGSNYARLLQLKRKYDPHGVFWCAPCVGAEDWTLDSSTGKLCKN